MSTSPAKYRKSFYRSLESQGLDSARQILPFVLENFAPESVVDVGCGSGEWLSVCQELGIEDITGLDFHNGAVLKIPKERFITHDLTKPIKLSRTFDLALSFEVGEHLAPSSADSFVQSITALASVVLFSAAIPSQGGTTSTNNTVLGRLNGSTTSSRRLHQVAWQKRRRTAITPEHDPYTRRDEPCR